MEKIKIPAKNLEKLEDNLLAGDIILLWRIAFGTFTNQTWFPKYFRYTYGIQGKEHLQSLWQKGYVEKESAFDSLDHINAKEKKDILKKFQVTGLSKLKSKELDTLLREHLSEEELGEQFSVRGYKLTEKGQKMLEKYGDVVDRHPKKNL